MHRLKVLTVVGARPQFVKASGVGRAIRARTDMIEVLVHTGQHFDKNMSDVFFCDLEIPEPSYHLGVGGLPHGAMTGRMLEQLEQVMLQENPDVVLVYGDTNSTLAGALAAAKLKIPLAHVEAGLRSFNRVMPEEINRVLTDHASDVLFVPTETASANLKREGIPASRVVHVGDVMYDVSLHYAGISERKSQILATNNLRAKSYILVTVHRAENTDDPDRLSAIIAGLNEVARRLPVVIPLHPRTKKIIAANPVRYQIGESMLIIDPVGYLDMITLERHAAVIATDSGGVQKESYFFGVPCVTLRDETEWVELVSVGANRLALPSSASMIASAILDAAKVGFPRTSEALYGDGSASTQITRSLLERFGR